MTVCFKEKAYLCHVRKGESFKRHSFCGISLKGRIYISFMENSFVREKNESTLTVHLKGRLDSMNAAEFSRDILASLADISMVVLDHPLSKMYRQFIFKRIFR